MIRRTFLLLPGVGAVKERKLWSSGVLSWDDFLERPSLEGISRSRKPDMDDLLLQANDALHRGYTEYFKEILPSGHQWRLFRTLRDGTTYLDIESDGLGHGAKITMVSMYRDGEMVTLTRGIDLNRENLERALQGTKMLVTFNGSTFDIPMIEKEFPFSVPRVPHFDLRHACPKVGLRGGLKQVEICVGMRRAKELEYVTGEEAVYLWHLWERKGAENALNLLRRYNREDTKNLAPLADLVYDRMYKRLFQEAVRCPEI